MEEGGEHAEDMVPAGGGVYMRKAVKPKRTKKERFQDYLDKTGVSAAILRGIISLYEDDNKPNDPIRYLCEQWGFGIPEIEEVDSLQAEVIQLREYFHQLTAETEELKILTKLKPTLEQELGLDEETQELLRKQGDELTRIQQREACFLKAFELSKIQERAKSKVKSKACAPFGPTEVGGDEGTPTLWDEEEGEGGEEPLILPPPTAPVLNCSQDLLEDEEMAAWEIESSEEDTTITITIPMEEIKNQPRHTCGQ